MKAIESSVHYLDEANPLKRIELAGRTCYKSDSEFTDESAVKFFNRMAKSKHYAMLEHGEATFELLGLDVGEIDENFLKIPYIRSSYKCMRYYITMSCSHMQRHEEILEGVNNFTKDLFYHMKYMFERFYIEGADESCLIEKLDNVQIKLLRDVTEIVDFNMADLELHKSETFKFICDRAVSHELVRHRHSVAQESQRYCNYSMDKFGNEITCVVPHDWDTWTEEAKQIFIDSCTHEEINYFKLLDMGKLPQDARRVLPNATKTEVILTMPIKFWYHFINLRSIGTTGAPHPDMKRLADVVNVQMKEIQNKYVNYIVSQPGGVW